MAVVVDRHIAPDGYVSSASELWGGATPVVDYPLISADVNGANKGFQLYETSQITDLWGYTLADGTGGGSYRVRGWICSYTEVGADGQSEFGVAIGTMDGFAPIGAGQQSAYLRFGGLTGGSTPEWRIGINNGNGNAESIYHVPTTTIAAPITAKRYYFDLAMSLSTNCTLQINGGTVAVFPNNGIPDFKHHGGASYLSLYAVSGAGANARHVVKWGGLIVTSAA